MLIYQTSQFCDLKNTIGCSSIFGEVSSSGVVAVSSQVLLKKPHHRELIGESLLTSFLFISRRVNP